MGFWSLDSASEEAVQIIEEEHGAFQTSIGALTLHWADLERVLRRTLRHYAGVSPEVGRALFSGTRARAAMAQVNSIAHNVGMDADRSSDLKEIFEVVSSINTMRDFIVHHVDGSLIESDDNDPRLRKLSDVDSKSRIGMGQTVWIGSALVYDMCHDITECCWRLQAHWESGPFRQGVGPSGAPSPWRYKSPQPILHDRGQPRPPNKPRQPRSSPS